MAETYSFGMIIGIRQGAYLMLMIIELCMMQDMLLALNFLQLLSKVHGSGLVQDQKLL